MPVNQAGGCEEVCRIVRERLEKIKVLMHTEVRHRPLFDALDRCTLIPTVDLMQLKNACLLVASLPMESKVDLADVGFAIIACRAVLEKMKDVV
jgi:hypothetical protein